MSKKHRKRKKSFHQQTQPQTVQLSESGVMVVAPSPVVKPVVASTIDHSTTRELKTIFLIVGFLLILTAIVVIVANRTTALDKISDSIIKLLNIQ